MKNQAILHKNSSFFILHFYDHIRIYLAAY